MDVGGADSIRDRVDTIFEGRVGQPPSAMEDYSLLVADGDSRYDMKIPPGFSDIDKEKNPKEAYFTYNGVRYERKFGDLIIWRQIINFVKSSNLENVIFVTSVSKEDWWWQESGKTIGARPELVREINSQTNIKRFWMYSSAEFIIYAKEYGSTSVSQRSVEEISQLAEIEEASSVSLKIRDSVDRISDLDPLHLVQAEDMDRWWFQSGASAFEEAKIFNWLRKYYNNIVRNEHGFDFYVPDWSRVYEVFYLSRVRGEYYARISDVCRRAKKRADDRGIVTAIVVAVISRSEIGNFNELVLKAQIDNVVKLTKIDGLIIGHTDGNKFKVHSFSEGGSLFGMPECC